MNRFRLASENKEHISTVLRVDDFVMELCKNVSKYFSSLLGMMEVSAATDPEVFQKTIKVGPDSVCTKSSHHLSRFCDSMCCIGRACARTSQPS